MTRAPFLAEIDVIDSHTGGEPTRVVIGGGPELGLGSISERCERFRLNHDAFRARVVNEPRGSDVLVGALLLPPHDPQAAAGVLFFNNVGVLGMCGHGTIGLLVTLHYLGRIRPGRHIIESPVGRVTATLHDANRVSVENVPSYRWRENVAINVPGYGLFHGDVAYGGNWFFLVREHGERIALDNVDRLSRLTCALMDALAAEGITGRDGARIDHVELFCDEAALRADSRNFVMCPGGAFDRSPCGTGTSAKVACLAADNLLPVGATYRQASICGSIFEASYRLDGEGQILPTITGTAYVCGHGKLLVAANDPFADGIRK